MMKTTRGRTVSGAVYCAAGASYIREAVRSARSLKRMHPELKIELFADVPVSDPIFDRCTVLPEGLPALAGKVHAVLNSSFDTCLFLDSDTLVVRTLRPLFDMLDEFDFVICNEPANVPGLATVAGPKYKNSKHFNTGVYLVRKTPAMVDFLERWKGTMCAADPAKVVVAGEFNDQTIWNRMVLERSEDSALPAWLGVADNLIFNARGGMFREMKRDGLFKDAAILHCHSIHAPLWQRFIWKLLSPLGSRKKSAGPDVVETANAA